MAKAKKAEPRVVEAENKMYELMFILQPELLETALKKKLKTFNDYLESNGVKVTLEDIWGKQNLAYRIKQFDEGIYVVYNFEGPTTFIKELDDHLRIDNEVIRHLIMNISSNYKYSKFDEEEEEVVEEKPKKKEAPKKVEKKEEPKKEEPKKEEPKEEVKEEVKEETKAEDKKESAEVDKTELDDKLDKILDGDDLAI